MHKSKAIYPMVDRVLILLQGAATEATTSDLDVEGS